MNSPQDRHDFRGANLRGRNFREKDLSGADFSGADIRGANFTKANLTEANFTGAKAGLQRRWVLALLMVVLVLVSMASAFSAGGLSSIVGWIVNPGESGERFGSWLGLVIAVILWTITVRRGIVASLGFVAFALALAFVFALVFALAGVGAFADAFLGTVLVAFALAVVVVVAVAVTAAVAVAVVVAIVVVLAGATAVALADADVVSSVVAAAGVVVVTAIGVYIGWRALRGDARDTWVRSLAVAFATIGGTSFRGANLTDANFAQAQLKSTDLRQAILTRTNWHQAKKLNQTRAADTILLDPAVRELVVTHRGQGKSYVGRNLQGANLIGADLSDADLKEADISQATLEGAWLERANLTKTQALGTDFYQTKLTGACLEAWNIDSTTQLEGAMCEYVYLLNHQQERRPNSGTFEPGEFTKLFAEVLDTIDLIFRNGLDWKAFIAAFDNVRVENGDTELQIQSIENKGDGVMVVKLQTSPDADKGKIHQSMMAEYNIALKAIEEKYRAQLNAKDGQISQYQQENMNLWEMTKLMANRPINVEASAVADSNSYDLRQAKFGGGFAAEGGMQIGGTLNDLSQTQDLTEAASKIQELLAQLQGQDVSADVAQDEAAQKLAEQAQKDPTMMGKLVSWGKALSGDASKAATSEAAKVAGGQAAKIVITKALTLLGLSLI